MNLLGFVFYGERLRQGGYYSRKYYKSYYHKYDNRTGGGGIHSETAQRSGENGTKSDSAGSPGSGEDGKADSATEQSPAGNENAPMEPEKADSGNPDRPAPSDRRRRNTPVSNS